MSENPLIPILAYHEVNNYNIRERKIRRMEPSCLIDVKLFEKQMESIIKFGLSTFCFSYEFEKRFDAKKNGREIVITFDDGHVGNYSFVFPILMEKKLNAIFFVSTNLVEKTEMMNWRQIREMSENGMSIQSHCVNHIPLGTLSGEEMKRELYVSKEIIEQKTGKEVFALSLPNGSMHKKIIQEARRLGYKFIFTSKIAYFNAIRENDVNLIPRIPVPDSLSLEEYNKIILKKSEIVDRWARKQKVKFFIRDLIGINNYRRIYRFVYQIQKD